MIEPAHAPPPSAAEHALAGDSRRAPRRSVQIAGFILGVVLLGWCVRVAFSEQNRAQLTRLLDARPLDLGVLVGLTLLSLLLNAGAFWTMIRTVRPVPARSVLGVHAVASALAYLPFKLSLVFRAAAHHRRDGVPILTIGAWMGNVGCVMLGVIGPAVLATSVRPEVDSRWFAIAGAGCAAACVCIIVIARLASRGGLWRWLHDRATPVAGAPEARWQRLVRHTHLLDRAHEGIGMLAHPSAVLLGALLRAIDIGAQSARFLVAARIVGAELSTSQAVAAAATYFIIGAVAPTGSLGFREAGVFALLRSEGFAVVILAVTAVEMVVQIACAVPAALYLRRRPTS